MLVFCRRQIWFKRNTLLPDGLACRVSWEKLQKKMKHRGSKDKLPAHSVSVLFEVLFDRGRLSCPVVRSCLLKKYTIFADNMDIVLRTLCNYWRKSLFCQNSKMYDGITAEMKSVRMLACALQRLYLRPLLCGFSVTLAWTFSGPGLGRLMLHCWGDFKMQTVQHVRSHYLWLCS